MKSPGRRKRGSAGQHQAVPERSRREILMSERAASDCPCFLYGEYSARPKLQPLVADISIALVFRPTGAFQANGGAPRHQIFSANGAALRQPGTTPQNQSTGGNRGPKVRANRAAFGPGLQPSDPSETANPGRCPGLAWSGALPLKMGGQR